MTMLYTQIGYLSMQVSEPVALRIARMPAYAQIISGRPPSLAEINRLRARHGLALLSRAGTAR